MDSIKSNKLNEKSELKAFMASIRSGNLVRIIESTQLQYDEKCNYLTQKLKKSEEEMRLKQLILKQNSHLIENFQKQLQELSDQNVELLGQQQIIKEENENLNAQLQCSEDKFTQLDILYDQQVFDLSERNNELEQQLSKLQNTQEQRISQFDKTQNDLNDMLTKLKQRNVDLLNELNHLEFEKKSENEELQNKLSELNDVLNQKTIDYEERIQDLQTKLSSALEGNSEIYELTNKVEKLNNARKADQMAFDIEKSRAVTANEELKAAVENLNIKLNRKEKELEDVYFKYKQITRLGSSTPTAHLSIHSGTLPNRRPASHDDPSPLDDSSDSDGSSVSFYKNSKFRRISTDPFETLQNDGKPEGQKNQSRVPSFGYKRKMPQTFDHIEIPESPIVSSSALGNNDQYKV